MRQVYVTKPVAWTAVRFNVDHRLRYLNSAHLCISISVIVT